MTVVILGCGYTGRRIAARMLGRGARVLCTSRHPEQLEGLDGAETVRLALPSNDGLKFVPRGAHVVYSIPPLEGAPDPDPIWQSLAEREPLRLVYLSTTGVYGDQRDVDQHTPPSPRHERDLARLSAERSVGNGPWSSLVLRPAAIYGPGRGIYHSMAQGRYRIVGDGANFVSRIHVDDLAAHVEAGLLSGLTGAWPVGDDRPCTSLEIARYCADLLSLPLPDSIPVDTAHHTRRADRRVDGSGVRRRLGIELKYPDYRTGTKAGR